MNRKKPFKKFRNIRVTNDGYQVVVTRAKIEVSKLFASHTNKSLQAAEKYRDELLNNLPPKRLNTVPDAILSALGLSTPVVGVFRVPRREQYAISYLSKDGRRHTKSFSWNVDGEVAAYTRAVKFRQMTLHGAV